MDLLADVNANGTTVVMVTHNPECAARAGRQLHIFDGRMADLEPAIFQPLNRPRAERPAADASNAAVNA